MKRTNRVINKWLGACPEITLNDSQYQGLSFYILQALEYSYSLGESGDVKEFVDINHDKIESVI